jgi:hypothetical protein
MSEWSKEDDLRSSVLRTRGFEPRSQHSRIHSSVAERKLSKLEVRGSKPLECFLFKRISHTHIMNKDRAILIHDMASLVFLAPFSALCIADVFLGYTVYSMFLTHAITIYMSYDLLWILLQPKIVHVYRSLIIAHHIVCLLALLRPIMYPEESRLISLVGLVEIDTTLLTLRRIIPRGSSIHVHIDLMYRISNLMIRVFYETIVTLFMMKYYENESLFVKIHVLGCQYFINIFSCGICALTYSKQNPALKN